MTSELEEAALNGMLTLATIPFSPQDVRQQDIIMQEMMKFADCPDRLAWTVGIAVAKWHKWLGLAELRGIYCTRFKPADGIEADCMETEGFTAGDNETAYMLEQAQETERKLAEWKRAAAELPEAERKANLELQLQPWPIKRL